MNLNHLVELTVRTRPKHTALEFYGADGALQSLSFRRGVPAESPHGCCPEPARRDARRRLCVYLSNSVDMIDLYLACVALGVIFVPINILYREREITHILADATAAVIVDGRAYSAAFPSSDTWQITELAAERLDSSLRPRANAPALDGDDSRRRSSIPPERPDARRAPCCRTTTSRERHEPGGVLAHDLGGSVSAPCCRSSTSTGSRTGCTGGSPAAACGWSSGSTSAAAELFAAFRPTVFFGVPTVYVRLLELPAESAPTIGAQHAALLSRLGPAAGDRPRAVPRTVRPHHPRALRHERDADEHQQSVHRRTPRRCGRPAAARGLDADRQH